ncbi:MAG: hypothetical protein AAGD25_13085 [Cyanobacteria bacterium P01_F01_bin.150]
MVEKSFVPPVLFQFPALKYKSTGTSRKLLPMLETVLASFGRHWMAGNGEKEERRSPSLQLGRCVTTHRNN